MIRLNPLIVPAFRSLSILVTTMTFLFSTAVSNSCAQMGSGDALEQIEGVRGGRHWIDQPTAAPKSPEESLACHLTEPGFEIRLVAAEPLVRDPVAIAFDETGRMFVVEYGDYPQGPPAGEDPLSRIIMLEDADNDGCMDRRRVFADKLNFAHSCMAYRGGLLVGAHSEILYLKDTDGDHKADVHDVLFSGFEPAHPQMQIGCPHWGIDNWISLTYGPGNITSNSHPNAPKQLPRRDFRFNPQTMEFEADSGLGQFGNSIDRWGNRFFCTNRNPIMTTLLPPNAVRRNPFAVVPNVQYDVAKSGGDTRVYPLVDMKSNYLSHAGTHTSACGVTAYLGKHGGLDLQNSVFVCEPIGHLVTRSVISVQEARLTAQRARSKADFLSSTDTWFRPVSLTNGPDGALYLADMYRLWVEHPKFLPPEIAARIDWRAGDDRGRIYRIVPDNLSPEPFSAAATTEQLVALLEDPGGWRQFLGQRLLVEQQNTGAVPLLRRLLQVCEVPTTRLHALWTLHGLKSLTADDLVNCLQDPNSYVRRDAVQLSSAVLTDGRVFSSVSALIGDTDARVRLELAVALGASDRPEATELLTRLALLDGEDTSFLCGLLTAVQERSGVILQGLTADESFMSQGNAAKINLVRQLASVAGARGDVEELELVLRILTAEHPVGIWWRAASISGLSDGLARHRGDLGQQSLTRLLADPPGGLADSASRLIELLADHQESALDETLAQADRLAAVELLAYRPLVQSSSVLDALLKGDQPSSLQAASLRALTSHGTDAAEIIVKRWPEIGPVVRGQALASLLRQPESTRLALTAMADGQMNASALSIDQRVRLLKHDDTGIRSRAQQLFGGAVSNNRREVAEQYEPALTLPASAADGAKVFQRVCARCHRVDGRGHDAGPDITDVRNRSRAAVLYEILDPNAKVDPQFTAYTVATVDGRTFSGLLASETVESIVLKMAEGRLKIIGRSEIEEVRSSGVSLMPEGIEKDVTVQNMADLLEYLKNRAPPPIGD